MVRFIAIACINHKQTIGKNGKLLYHINNDMANFSRMTKHEVVIMGRKTFESLPNNEPLKDRINIILTSHKEYGVNKDFDNVYIAHSIGDVVELCEAFFSDKKLYVIGGEKLYNQFIDLGLVDELRLTIVNDDAEGDVTFPGINEEDWYTYFRTCEQNEDGIDKSFYFCILKKKK